METKDWLYYLGWIVGLLCLVYLIGPFIALGVVVFIIFILFEWMFYDEYGMWFTLKEFKDLFKK